MTTTTIELSDELHNRAEALAQSTGRSLEEILTEAVATGLAYDHWFRTEVGQALDSTTAGRFATSEEVEAMWQRLTTSEAMAEAEAELHGLGPV